LEAQGIAILWLHQSRFLLQSPKKSGVLRGNTGAILLCFVRLGGVSCSSLSL